MRIVLASASPRRKELLALLYPHFECMASDIDESIGAGEMPDDYVCRMAIEKAQACAVSDGIVVAADTTVTLNNEVLGKPKNREHARTMLQRLSGCSHRVLTSVAIRLGSQLRTRLVASNVSFADLSADLIDQYLQTSEPWDKAGAYGIQGFAGSFVSTIEGSYSAVVGLPLLETRELLVQFGVAPVWQSLDA